MEEVYLGGDPRKQSERGEGRQGREPASVGNWGSVPLGTLQEPVGDTLRTTALEGEEAAVFIQHPPSPHWLRSLLGH